jgi:quercetin dioxygenase-like cupin family protein
MKTSQPIRRIITGHGEAGKAIFSIDESLIPIIIPSGDAAMATLWTTATVPGDCNDPTDGSIREAGTTLKGGSVLRVVDMLPDSSSPMHRSNSIDYGIVLEGEIELELDNGVFETIKKGDIIVQRGTIHRWRNRSSTEICRIIFVLIESKPYQFNNQDLPEVMIHEV